MSKMNLVAQTMLLAGCLAAIAPAASQSLAKPSKMELIKLFSTPQEKFTKSFRPVQKVDLVQCGGGETAEAAKKGGRLTRTLEAIGTTMPAINLDVSFKYDSDELTSDAKTVLDEVGGALTDSSLRASRFAVTGHTDAKGAEDYNFLLSCARAVSVRNYLENRHGITRDRLVLKGAGYSQLLDTTNPESPVNRRVELRKVGE